jgi:histidinol dehydrogenase
MIPTYQWSNPADRAAMLELLGKLRLDARSMLLPGSPLADKTEAVRAMLVDVARRGDDAIVELVRRFDDPNFSIDKLRVTPQEMKEAHERCSPEMIRAMRRSIAQVREYQSHIMPAAIATLDRGGAKLGLRYTPIDSVGLHVPGGKASYPSSLIMLAVPAQVAGVKRIVVTTPASKHSENDLLLAAAHELQIAEMYRAGGTGAIGAFAMGTQSIAAVDKIVGPGNTFIQLAKKLVSSAVGIDGFYGPSEILVVADESATPSFVAADLIAQAEHDPGRCFLLTTSASVAFRVKEAIADQMKSLSRSEAIARGLADGSAIVVSDSMNDLIDLANQIAAEHVNLQVRDPEVILRSLVHAGAIFVGPYSPVAAGDYVAGPSHSLPTNTTARFGGGISVYEFLKRSGVVEYSRDALARDVPAIVEMARAEGLDAHARSATIRME